MTDFSQESWSINAALTDLWKAVDAAEPSELVWADALKIRKVLVEANNTLRQVRERWDNLIAENMGVYQRDGVKRHPNKTRRDWQSDDLLRVVLDSRVVNGETGEVESQVDCLKAVYQLKGYNASLKELERRGIDPDEWCQTETRGWKLEVK